MRRGVSVKLFLVDGTPEGLKVVEKSNWTGIGLMCSRVQFADIQKRPEFNRPCVYVLLGPNESDGQPRIYIGEADVARLRIAQHAKGFDFWTHFILFTSKDPNLNKAHVKYLESRLVGLAHEAKRVHLENKNIPPSPQLAEADIADVESFLDDMLILYPLLGLHAFETVKESSTARLNDDLLLTLNGPGTNALGKQTSEGLVVLKDSRGRVYETPSMHEYGRSIRKSLVGSGVLRLEGDQYVVTQDYPFDSPSTAAMVLLGRAANGRTEWKTKSGSTLKSMQDDPLKSP